MRPRRTPSSNHVFRLAGGTEDNDLPVRLEGMTGDDARVVAVFEPEPGERAAIASGANVELTLWGRGVPPMALGVTREQPMSRPQRADPAAAHEPRLWAELPEATVVALLEAIAVARVELGDDLLQTFAGDLQRALEALRALGDDDDERTPTA